MATSADRLSEAHRLAQGRIGIETASFIEASLPLLDLDDIDGSTPNWLRVVVPAVESKTAESAQLAGEYTTRVRALEIGADAAYRPVLVTPNSQQIATSLTVTGPVKAKQLVALGRLYPQIREILFVSTVGAGQRLALEGGRRTITTSVRNDRRAIGWARIGSGHSCAFCSMLISRGPVYKSDTVGFRPHDNCSCGVRPVYDGGRFDGWSPQARRLQELWKETTRGEVGGQAMLNAFRRAIERP